MHWEYLVIKDTLDANELNKVGTEGWELVAVVSSAHFVLHHFFKRKSRT